MSMSIIMWCGIRSMLLTPLCLTLMLSLRSHHPINLSSIRKSSQKNRTIVAIRKMFLTLRIALRNLCKYSDWFLSTFLRIWGVSSSVGAATLIRWKWIPLVKTYFYLWFVVLKMVPTLNLKISSGYADISSKRSSLISNQTIRIN